MCASPRFFSTAPPLSPCSLSWFGNASCNLIIASQRVSRFIYPLPDGGGRLSLISDAMLRFECAFRWKDSTYDNFFPHHKSFIHPVNFLQRRSIPPFTLFDLRSCYVSRIFKCEQYVQMVWWDDVIHGQPLPQGRGYLYFKYCKRECVKILMTKSFFSPPTLFHTLSLLAGWNLFKQV